uniref:Plasminogen n=1 Tax=Magallana gigas TaxID=29159 RepID=K1QHL8_MAGGI
MHDYLLICCYMSLKASEGNEERENLVHFLRSLNLELPLENDDVRDPQSDTQKRQITSDQKKYLDAHNAARSNVNPSAANMKKMSDAKYSQYTYNCKPIPDKDCYTGDGSSYSGTVSKTASGKTCLTWSNVYPFLPNNNHCRNYFAQYGITEPVCYMQAGTYYVESCGIPKCGEIVLLETH